MQRETNTFSILSRVMYVYGFIGLRLFRCVRYVLHLTIWLCSFITLSEYHSVVLARIGLRHLQGVW
jgi:hypothetical protein